MTIDLGELIRSARKYPASFLQACFEYGKRDLDRYVLEIDDAKFEELKNTVVLKAEATCRSCEHFWIEQQWCMAKECNCPRKENWRPWQMLARCPIGKW
jgi:hypothetical protein